LRVNANYFVLLLFVWELIQTSFLFFIFLTETSFLFLFFWNKLVDSICRFWDEKKIDITNWNWYGQNQTNKKEKKMNVKLRQKKIKKTYYESIQITKIIYSTQIGYLDSWNHTIQRILIFRKKKSKFNHLYISRKA